MKSTTIKKRVKAKADKSDTIKEKKPNIKKYGSTRDRRRPALKARFLELLLDEEVLGNVKYAAIKLGINRATLYEWREKDPKFAAAWDEVIPQADDLLADEAENGLLRLIKANNVTAIIYTLNNRRPDRWRARFVHGGEGGNPIKHTHTMSPEFEDFLTEMGYGKNVQQPTDK